MSSRLQVMKFGGTSVGDAACIARTAQIVVKAAGEASCIVVVSAMSGVTNRLIDAAQKAAAGDATEGANIVKVLRSQHVAALETLITDQEARARVAKKLDEVLAEAKRLCDGSRFYASFPRARSTKCPASESASPRRWLPRPSNRWAGAANPSKPPS